MRKIIVAASVLLLVQIGLAVALNIGSSPYRAVAPNTPFLTMDPGAVDSITITGGDGKSVVIKKEKSGWVLPAAYNAPANSDQVSGLLKKLANIKEGLAVAITPDAAKRFKTANDGFERHLVVKQGDTITADLFLGTPDGIHNIHARKKGDKAVYSIGLASYDVDTSPSKWLDRNMAALDAKKLTELDFSDFTLTNKEKSWQLAGLPKTETDSEEAGNLIGKVCNLKVQAVLDPKEVSGLFKAKPAFGFTVKLKDGKHIEYAFNKPDNKKDNYYVMKLSNRDFYFKVYNWQVENLQKFTLAKLRNSAVAKSKSADTKKKAQQ